MSQPENKKPRSRLRAHTNARAALLMSRPNPERMARDSTSILTNAARKMAKVLGLEPPTTQQPGYWRTEDGFIVVNTGLLKYSFRSVRDSFWATIVFEPRNLEAVERTMIEREFPDYAHLPSDEKRNVWTRVLEIRRQARRERVAKILRDLDAMGIDLDVKSLQVHRVARRFSLRMDLRTLNRLLKIKNRGYGELRHLKIEEVPIMH